jgi:hypothetical protein
MRSVWLRLRGCPSFWRAIRARDSLRRQPAAARAIVTPTASAVTRVASTYRRVGARPLLAIASSRALAAVGTRHRAGGTGGGTAALLTAAFGYPPAVGSSLSTGRAVPVPVAERPWTPLFIRDRQTGDRPNQMRARQPAGGRLDPLASWSKLGEVRDLDRRSRRLDLQRVNALGSAQPQCWQYASPWGRFGSRMM